MLTWRELEALCGEGKPLVRWTVGRRNVPASGRALYLKRSIHERITASPWPGAVGESPTRTQVRRQALRSVLERYVVGHAIRVNYDMKDLGTKRLDANMQGYFAFRSQGPMTETRLLGFFARPGAFVATGFRTKDELPSQKEWDEQRQQCGEAWRDITGSAPFLNAPWPVQTRVHLNAYLSAKDD